MNPVVLPADRKRAAATVRRVVVRDGHAQFAAVGEKGRRVLRQVPWDVAHPAGWGAQAYRPLPGTKDRALLYVWQPGHRPPEVAAGPPAGYAAGTAVPEVTPATPW